MPREALPIEMDGQGTEGRCRATNHIYGLLRDRP